MNQQTKHGHIEISPTAIASLVSHAARQTYGVVAMAESTRVGSIASTLRRDPHKGIGVQVDGQELMIDVYVIIKYGTNLASVANSLISAIRYHVEDRTAYTVKQINIHIQGMRGTAADSPF